MDIDQRLEKLTERHEALSQSVELLVHTQHEAFAKNQVLLAHVIESIDSLARIAHVHEQRITGLEDRPQ